MIWLQQQISLATAYSVLQEIITKVAYEKRESTKENEVALPENCMKEWFTVLVEDNIDQLEETLSDELRSRECYTNNLFPANKWVKPFCMVNWRLLLLLLFIYLFIYLIILCTANKVNSVIFQPRGLSKYCSTPWKWWWPFYRTSRTYLPTCKEKV